MVVEFKTPDWEGHPEQHTWLAVLEAAGVRTAVWRRPTPTGADGVQQVLHPAILAGWEPYRRGRAA